MNAFRRAALGASLLVLAACSSMGTPAPTSAAIAPWGVDLAGMDTAVRPGDDFFRYAGGTWMRNTVMPGDRSRWGSFDMLREKSDTDVKETVDANAAATHAPGSVGQKVADYNKAFLDTATIEAKGLEPARADLADIAAAKTHQDIAALMARPELGTPPFAMGVVPDQKDPSRYIFSIGQGGLGLPDRDYYLKDDKKFRDIRTAYVAYIAQMLRLAGYAAPDKSARTIMALETEMAKVSWERAKRRNRDLTYNYMSRAQLIDYAGGFPWDAALATRSIPGFDRFVLREKDAVEKLSVIFGKTPVATWKAYLTFHYLNAYAPVLPKAYDDASFNFAKRISGQAQQRARWKRSNEAMGGALGEALGQLYVERHFSPTAKDQMMELVENIRAAYRARIEALDWMGPATKQQALAKLAGFGVKIAYPDQWRDYSALEVRGDDALGNERRSAIFEWNRDAARIDQPVDKSEWRMTPQTVNAYYNPTFNEIVFPAAILQPPFFDAAADPAVNYGAIGAVIGHEMGHGFDDQGSKSDANGILRNWWTEEDNKRFKERTKALGAQYSAFEPLPGLHVNGDLTMGENIGDLGGISVAHEAYLRSLDGKEPPVLDGFTGEQRFFLAYAQVWRGIIRDEELQNRVMTDPHSPAEYRANGAVRNVDAWYDAFDVGPDAKLYIAPEKRVRIW